MKVKILSRNPDECMRETIRDIHKVPRNYDPALHPFEAPREYVRALNAVKLDRAFSKPFIANLDGHRDTISCMSKQAHALTFIASGDYCGEVRVWDIPRRNCKLTIQAHNGGVRGIAFCNDNERFISVGQDMNIKIWGINNTFVQNVVEPLNIYISKSVLTGITHCIKEDKFATCGDVCQLWDESRSEPIKTMIWKNDSLLHIAYNPIETFLLAGCANDRTISLYDTRSGPIRGITLGMKSNQLSWNPMEAYTLSAANEDHNVYTFDTRNWSMPVNIHKDNTDAVTCIDYAPTGREFVTGSYDKTIRIFETAKGHSREVYHTKRMQNITNVCWSMDNKFVLSSSSDMNIRIWKAQANEKLGVMRPRERVSRAYNDAVRDKFQHHPLIRRIHRHRHLPKRVLHQKQQIEAAKQKIKRKEGNRRQHSKKGAVPYVPERKKPVVSEDV